MSVRPSVVPIHAILDESETGPNPSFDARQALHDAEVILGVDVMSEREFLVYGSETLRLIVANKRPADCRVLRIGIDQESDELERLLAIVQVVKGKHDYQN